MARCKDCLHYAVCGKQRFITQVDSHTFDEYNQVDGVEKYCYEYTPPTAYVATRAEVAREIFEEIEKLAMYSTTPLGLCLMSIGAASFTKLKIKYTEDNQ